MQKIDLSKPKLILHNMTIAGIEKVDGILDFDQRGIVYANSGDVIITGKPVEKDYMNYLNSLGWSLSKVKFKTIYDNRRTWNSIFKRNIKVESNLNHLDTYQNTKEEDKYSSKIKLPLYGSGQLGTKLGTKSKFRKTAKEIGLKVCFGFEYVSSEEKLIECLEKIKEFGAKSAVIKIDEGVSGAGNTKTNLEEFWGMSYQKQIDFLSQAMNKIPQADHDSATIVEEWVENITVSPSIQLQITPKGQIIVNSIHEQILEGKEKWYIGCIQPPKNLTSEIIQAMVEDGKKYARHIAKLGIIGFFGLDAIITSDGKLYWVEANLRKPATFYPRIIAEKLNRKNLNNVFYFACDFTWEKLRGANFAILKNCLEDILFPINNNFEGVIPYNVKALEEAGRFDVVCLARSHDRAKELYNRVCIIGKKLEK